jgi:prepilin-type N-terminal cleavage/methylation domain-containing protein
MQRGFTLVELLIVMALAFVLVVAAVPIYGQLQVRAQLTETSAQVVQTLRAARENSLARFHNSTYGVFLNLSTTGADSYVLYQGASYAARDVNYDRVVVLENSLSFTNLNFATTTNGNIDINFSSGLGLPNNTGSLSLNHLVQGTSVISVNSLGKVEEN